MNKNKNKISRQSIFSVTFFFAETTLALVRRRRQRGEAAAATSLCLQI